MAIYENSRYTNVYAYDEEYKGKPVISFDIRPIPKIDVTNETPRHIWIDSDRLDILSLHVYGDSQFWWFILDANPQYFEETDIKTGDELVIPPYSALREVVVNND